MYKFLTSYFKAQSNLLELTLFVNMAALHACMAVRYDCYCPDEGFFLL